MKAEGIMFYIHGDVYVSEDFINKDPFWVAVLLGRELDELILMEDFDCSYCHCVKGQHTAQCWVGKLLVIRKRMVPMVI